MNTIQVTMWGDGIDVDTQTLPKLEDTEYDVPFDVFSLIVELLKQNNWGVEIHSMIREKRIPTDFAISAESQEYAGQIRKYFKQNFFLRRLKNEFMSEWMKTVDVALDATRTVKQSWLAPLISLPRYYEENIATEKIFKTAKSLDPLNLNRTYQFSGEVTFVGKIHRVAKNENTWRYYFKDKDNHLLLLIMQAANTALPAWDYIVENSKSIELDGSIAYNLHPGFDTLHYRLTTDYRIVKINS